MGSTSACAWVLGTSGILDNKCQALRQRAAEADAHQEGQLEQLQQPACVRSNAGNMGAVMSRIEAYGVAGVQGHISLRVCFAREPECSCGAAVVPVLFHLPPLSGPLLVPGTAGVRAAAWCCAGVYTRCHSAAVRELLAPRRDGRPTLVAALQHDGRQT